MSIANHPTTKLAATKIGEEIAAKGIASTVNYVVDAFARRVALQICKNNQLNRKK